MVKERSPTARHRPGGGGPFRYPVPHAPLGAGVTTSITGRGSIPEDLPLCIGAFPLEAPVQALLREADVLVAVGTRFQGCHTQSWSLQIPWTLVHIDVDAEEIGRNYPAA